jgi:AraC-like DNA-binding protein
VGSKEDPCSMAPSTPVGLSDELYSATKLSAIVDALVEQGIPARDVLRGVHIRGPDLHSPATRISLNQLLAVCRNAVALSDDPRLAFKIGSTIHLSAYGMYGYAMLCSADFRHTMEFAQKYHQLATPLTQISLDTGGQQAVWSIMPIRHRRIDAALQSFIIELQIGIHLSLHRDVMGPLFRPCKVTLDHAPRDVQSLRDAIGCPVVADMPTNQIVFERKWLDMPPQLGNRITFASLLPICDDLLADLARRGGTAGRLREILLRDIADRPTLEDIAERLRTTPRTLRRRLKAQNTSFRELVDDLRAQAAVKYLQETAMTNEDIALALGYSDGANFRHAFRRWTGVSPARFRRESGQIANAVGME